MVRYSKSIMALMASSVLAAPAIDIELPILEDRTASNTNTNSTTAASTLNTTAATGSKLDCSPGSKQGLQTGCWDQLNMTGYIDAWLVANGSEAKCSSLGFAQCFLQFNSYSGLTCDLITSNTCPPFDTTNGTYESDQQFYALWNIYSIYQFFNQYSLALTAGSSLAGQTIGKIVSTIAPKVESSAAKKDLLTVLMGTMSVVSFVTGLIPGDLGTGVGILTGGLSAIMTADKNFATQLSTPSQTANDRFVQLGDIGNELANIVSEYQANLQDMVKTVQGNTTLFKAAGTKGAFSQRITTSLQVQANDLFKQLRLFVLSQALKTTGIISSRSTNINALDVAKRTDAITCQQTGAAGNCFQWWIDVDKNNTYAFHNPNDWRNTQIDLTNAIVNNGWANLSDIFKVEDCAGKNVTFDTMSITPTCIVNHNWCEWNYTLPTTVSLGHNPQWMNCPNDEPWGTLCSSFDSSIDVPESYLGPLLFTDGAYCKN